MKILPGQVRPVPVPRDGGYPELAPGYGRGVLLQEHGRWKLPELAGYLGESNFSRSMVRSRRPHRSRLIESFIVNIPVPPVIFWGISCEVLEVIDGQGRLAAIQDFYEGSYELSGLQLLPSLNGRRTGDLAADIRGRLDRRSLETVTLFVDSDDDEGKLLMGAIADRYK